jgi:hypothetical protein
VKYHFRVPILLFALLLSFSIATASKALIERDFKVIVSAEERGGQTQYYRQTLRGVEQSNNSLNRLSMLSENQSQYPEPESGCGPTAMLNILVWYEKYGLIEPYSRNADPDRYKLELFTEIDRRLAKHSGTNRAERNGVNSIDVAMVMDSMVRERSNNRVRIHTKLIKAPLKLSDFLETMQNFRSGFIIVSPKDRTTGELLGDHAATVIRADRSGYITLATWGEIYRGLLKQRPDGQWFIPQDPNQMELRVQSLTRFIPFKPIAVEDQ